MMRANVDVKTATVDPVIFHLTGKRAGSGLEPAEGLRPALLAHYRDLTQLRYDMPLVLIEGPTQGAAVRSLSNLIDGLLRNIAPPGIESEQLRKMILRLEREIRTLTANGATGLLSELWDQAAARLEAKTDEAFGKSVRIARAALDVDGQVIDCDAAMAGRMVAHLWSSVQNDKAARYRATASRLAIKLADILRADFFGSKEGRSADSLKASIGPTHQALFDFSALSQLLPQAPSGGLPQARRRRIEGALSVIKGQRFFALVEKQAKPDRAAKPHQFTFTSCADALAAYRSRLPEMVALVKALSIAELEADGTYIESKHTAFFDGFDVTSLSEQDRALFPDYLVSLGGPGNAAESSGLIEALSSGVPLKLLVNVHDLLEEGAAGDGHFTFGLRGAQIARSAAVLGDVFVLQSSGSNLYRMRERVMRGLSYPGSALFAVYSGAPAAGTLPLYLNASAAMQSRAFPAFSYDPGAGENLASRYSLEDNPVPEADWTALDFEYADDAMQRVKEQVAFTFVDFLASDPRYARHFARVARAQWNEGMVPVSEWLAQDSTERADAVPYILAVDKDNVLVRVVADDKAIAAARRCLETWHRLQELGGVHNSYAERLLKQERAAWEEQKRKEFESLSLAAKPAAAAAPAAAPVAAAAPAAAAAAPAPEEPERSKDEAYIETVRCSTCNECTQINDRMFKYNDDKQAYIADINAGTYRQLVEAAENCQLGIIHPGKPVNKSEPGIEELMKRAEALF